MNGNLWLKGMIIYLPLASFRASWIYALQGILLVVFAIAVPYMNIGSISLLNKFSPADDQVVLTVFVSSTLNVGMNFERPSYKEWEAQSVDLLKYWAQFGRALHFMSVFQSNYHSL